MQLCAGWWTDPSIATAAQAYEVFDASLEKFRHLSALFLSRLAVRSLSRQRARDHTWRLGGSRSLVNTVNM